MGSDANSVEQVTRAEVGVLSVICSPVCVRYAISESRSLGLERKVSGKLHLKFNIFLRPISNKYHEGHNAKDFENMLFFFKRTWNCWKGIELDNFRLVRLAHDASNHVSVCVVACFVCQEQFICELICLHRPHSLSVCGCVHASWGLQQDCFKRQVTESDSSSLLFDSWRWLLTTWSRSTRFEIWIKEFNM